MKAALTCRLCGYDRPVLVPALLSEAPLSRLVLSSWFDSKEAEIVGECQYNETLHHLGVRQRFEVGQ